MGKIEIYFYRYLTKKVAENGYTPFVVIRPENDASQSLYKKLGFRKLYTIVRMTFIPNTNLSTQTDEVLNDNLINSAMQQLHLPQDVFSIQDVDASKADDAEELFTRIEETLEPIEERSEEENTPTNI